MLAAKFQVIFPHLDERQRRLLMGAEARALGHGGIRWSPGSAGREATVSLGAAELESGEEPLARGRRRGGGRKRSAEGIQSWSRRCWRWSGRRNGAIRCRRCGGRPSRRGCWPAS